jgi:hypothetical protein
MKSLITLVAVLFFGVCTSFAQEKPVTTNNGKSIDCHLKLDGVKGESTHEKSQATQEGNIEYSYKPQKAVAPSGGDNSSTETEEIAEPVSKPRKEAAHVPMK